MRGYRGALAWIPENHQEISVSTETILHLHFLRHGRGGDAGQFKTKDSDIIERHPDARSRVRFKTVAAKDTRDRVKDFAGLWQDCLREQWAPPPIALAAAKLDFLCIHPFRDGNGRVSRLLLLLMAYHLGFEVGRYISVERLVEANKERYYETLEQSSGGWHEVASPRGAKTALVRAAIHARTAPFTPAALEQECPGVSRDLIRRVLGQLRKEGMLEAIGRDPGAEWRKKR